MGGLNSRCSKQKGGQWLPWRMMPLKCDWFFSWGGGWKGKHLNSASTNIPHKVGTVRDYACFSSKGRRAGSRQRGEELPCQSWLCSCGTGEQSSFQYPQAMLTALPLPGRKCMWSALPKMCARIYANSQNPTQSITRLRISEAHPWMSG